MSLTVDQQRAIRARGNVVLSAGAGTGKTKTLVERCLSCLVDHAAPALISEMLLVTFTEAAAAEMRHRIRSRLEDELQKDPSNARWQEQLALFEQAHIGTLHSFCLKLVRQHFHELALDPQLAVMPDEEARLISEETLDGILRCHYEGSSPDNQAVRDLIFSYGRRGDWQVRKLVMRLHTYSQTLPDPAAWFRNQTALFASTNPHAWEQWLLEKFGEWRAEWLALFDSGAHDNEVGRGCAKVLRELSVVSDRESLGQVMDRLDAACLACPKGKKGAIMKPLKSFEADIAFLKSLVPGGGRDPLREDWEWVRSKMAVLLRLTETFGTEFSEAKKETGLVDFHDLEQHALRLLWDPDTGRPTPVAQQWRKQLRYVFVDEYQDINAAQDRILEALSGEGSSANRFLVGDVKQSIYRFRLANPRIFQRYTDLWSTPGNAANAISAAVLTSGGSGSKESSDRTVAASDNSAEVHSLPLVDNFRTRERLLDFINSVFELVMRPEVGGIAYDAEARLVFGAPAARLALGSQAAGEPCAELHLRLKDKPGAGDDQSSDDDDALTEVADLEEASREARLVGFRLKALKQQGYQVYDDGAFRPMRWADAAILLRSPSGKAENYAREFARLHIPLVIARSSFYGGLEIKDLVSLLQTLDNPLQDVPLVAVLRSPLVGLDITELGEIRLAAKGFYWFALKRWFAGHAAPACTGREPVTQASSPASLGSASLPNPSASVNPCATKVQLFLARFQRWRRLARQGSISKCLETVLAETHYDLWLAGQPRGRQRQSRVEQLLGLARQFDSFQRQGLFRFLRFLEAQKEADAGPEAPEAPGEDAVRLMSIHQSKGLEFPVVALCDLGKPFNLSDLRSSVILDDQYGLCPQVRPPGTPAQYPSVVHWLAASRQLRELLGDEIRLLYVAMTRARDRLLLVGSISKGKFEKFKELTSGPIAASLARARSYADWIGLWFARTVNGNMEGQTEVLSWSLYEDADLALAPDALPLAPENGDKDPGGKVDWEAVQTRLQWSYAHQDATREPAKASVSALKRRALSLEEAEQGSRPQFASLALGAFQGARRTTNRLTAAEIGSAHHSFMEHLDLTLPPTLQNLERERDRMLSAGALEMATAESLDLAAIGRFWGSEVGKMVRAHSPDVRRELQFTARFPARELAPLFGMAASYQGEETVIVQGTADLVVLMKTEIWVLDFKTDRIEEKDLVSRAAFYRPQLELYSRVLENIYGRPVTRRWLHFLALGKTCDSSHT